MSFSPLPSEKKHTNLHTRDKDKNVSLFILFYFRFLCSIFYPFYFGVKNKPVMTISLCFFKLNFFVLKRTKKKFLHWFVDNNFETTWNICFPVCAVVAFFVFWLPFWLSFSSSHLSFIGILFWNSFKFYFWNLFPFPFPFLSFFCSI